MHADIQQCNGDANNPENIVPRIKIHSIQHFNTPYYYYYNKLYIIDDVCKYTCVRARFARACACTVIELMIRLVPR